MVNLLKTLWDFFGNCVTMHLMCLLPVWPTDAKRLDNLSILDHVHIKSNLYINNKRLIKFLFKGENSSRTQFQSVCGGFPIPTNRLSENSTQFWHYQWEIASSLTVSGLSPTKLAPPSPTPVICLDCHLGFWPTRHVLEFPTTPFLGSVNLLQLRIELREAVYSLDHWFIIKGYNSGTAR